MQTKLLYFPTVLFHTIVLVEIIIPAGSIDP